MSSLQAAVDLSGNRLWLHLTCGITEWASDQPEWCPTCSFRTDRWYLVHVDCDQPCERKVGGSRQ